MEREEPSGVWKSRTRLRLVVLILLLWSLAGVSFSSNYQQEPATPTPGVQATDTGLPSETPTSTYTDTPPSTPTDAATATIEPTYTESPSSTVPPTYTLLPSSTVAPSSTAPPSTAIEAAPVIPPTPTSESPATSEPRPAQLRGDYVPDQVLIRFRRRADKEAIDQCLQASGASIESEIEPLSVLVLTVPQGSVAQSIANLSTCPDARFAEPNYLVQIADTIPSDSDWSLQYGLINIRAPQGWDLSTGSPAVTIAIVDTGIDLGHPDLAAKIVPGYDFVDGDNTAQDDNGHGTHVAGSAAAITNNALGVAGVSWGAQIMPVKVLDAAGNGTFADLAAGITYAADNGAQVINLSLGGSSSSAVLEAAVNYAYGKGAVLVAAAGNDGANVVLYPARYTHVIAVAATDITNARAGFSNYGSEIALAAPGVNIYSTRPGGTYGYLTGTSMAVPYVSGLAAILRGIPGIGSPDVIAWDMESTSLDLGPSGRDALYGYGLIQMDRAIGLALAPTAIPEAGHERRRQGPGQAAVPFAAVTLTPSPIFASTFTPSATTTAIVPSGTPGASETAEVGALHEATPGSLTRLSLASIKGNDWPLGCSGGLLIVLGILLASRHSGQPVRRSRRRYFKMG